MNVVAPERGRAPGNGRPERKLKMFAQRPVTVIAVLFCASICLGQGAPKRVTGGKPAKRLTVKEEVQQLKDEVRDLTATVAGLRMELAELRAELAGDRSAPDEESPARRKPGRAPRKIAVGMTLAEVERIAEAKGVLVHEDERGKTYSWTLSNARQIVESVEPDEYGTYTVLVKFRDDRLVLFRLIDNRERTGKDRADR